MTTRIIVVRHGNTFEAGETPLRIGSRTDLPLTQEGHAQAKRLAVLLRDKSLIPNIIYTAPLKRTSETAIQIHKTLALQSKILHAHFLTEIDYGSDEGCDEDATIRRIGRDLLKQSFDNDESFKAGQKSIEQWNLNAIPPIGWHVDVNAIKAAWVNFAYSVITECEHKTVLAVTSNGIARFSPVILNAKMDANLKIATGAACVFEHDGNEWICSEWNLRPQKE